MTLIFDHHLEQMTLAKYKKDQTCSDWTDIEVLLLWPWPVALALKLDLGIVMTYFYTNNKIQQLVQKLSARKRNF